MHQQGAPILEETAAAPSRWRQQTWFVAWRLLAIVAFAGVGWVAFQQGQALRVWAWSYTAPIHFYPDMNNGYYWGSQAWESPDPRNRQAPPPGILNVYDVVAKRAETQAEQNEQRLRERASRRGRSADDIEVAPEYGLDYAPLRLTLISKWVKWGHEAHPDLARKARIAARHGSNDSFWEAPYVFYEPLLNFNTAMEIVAMVGLFLLARHWVVRGWRGTAKPAIPAGRRWPWYRLYDWFTSDRPFRGWIAGSVAALLFWFNPAILLSAHGWPTWDMWVIPFFVWAIYLACIDFWFVSGLVIAAGAMFKGQQLLVAPLFLLWPIFAGRPLMALRWAAGCVFGVGAIGAPWLLTYVPDGAKFEIGSRVLDRPAVMWLAAIAVATLALPPLVRWLRPWRKHDWHPVARWATWVGVLLVIAACAWGPFRGATMHWGIGVGFALAIVAGVALLPIRWTPILAAASLGIALLLCGTLYQGSTNWASIGWGYGTRHYRVMQQGMSDNLAGILQRKFGWSPPDTVFEYHDGLTAGLMAALIAVYCLVYLGVVKVGVLSWRGPAKWRPVVHVATGIALCLLYLLLLEPYVLNLAWYTPKPLFTRGLDIPPDAEALNVPIRSLLISLYVILFIPCVIGAAIHYRRNDPRFLVAITATWVVFFAFLPQMHERYLIYAAGVACALTAVGTGFTLLGVFMSVWTTVMTLHPMLSTCARGGRLTQFLADVSPTAGNTLFQFVRMSHPDAGWAVILVALIFVYASLAPSKRSLA